MTSAPAIGFDYRPSHWQGRLPAVVAVLALLATASSGIPWWIKLPLAVGVVVLAGASIRRASRSDVAGVGLAGAQWTLYATDRREMSAQLVSFRILGGCILLRLKAQDGLRVLLLAPDNSDADLRRRMRMRLAAMQAAEPVAPV